MPPSEPVTVKGLKCTIHTIKNRINKHEFLNSMHLGLTYGLTCDMPVLSVIIILTS